MKGGNKLLKNRNRKKKKEEKKKYWSRNVILYTANFDNLNSSKRLMIKKQNKNKTAIPCFPDFCPYKVNLNILAVPSPVIISVFLVGFRMEQG